jgi:two-component system, cell cycle response regulator DivK
MTQRAALIIDDNDGNLDVLAELLEMEGMTSITVRQPERLEAALGSYHQLDVIFLDLEMPGIDGYTMLSYLKNDERFKAVPVVAYTVHVSQMNVARQRGFHSFLGKPLDADRFPEQLARILRGERVWTNV